MEGTNRQRRKQQTALAVWGRGQTAVGENKQLSEEASRKMRLRNNLKMGTVPDKCE